MSRHEDWREVGGADALDTALPPARTDGVSWLQPLRSRAALGLAPAVAPAVVFVPIGAALGPAFTNVLNPTALGHLDAVVAVALAVLGVFAGLALALEGPRDRRVFAAASLEAGVTLLIVAGAFLVLLGAWGLPLGLPIGAVATTLGLCASVSAASSSDDTSPAHVLAVRIADLDDVLPIVVSGLVVVLVGRHLTAPAMEVATWAGWTVLLGGAMGLAGWMLFDHAHSRAERNVFVAGILALIGGTTSYLGLSPLLAGLVAGLLWVWLPGHADRVVREDLQRVQHPLLVVLLLVAGASCEFSRQMVWLGAPLVLFRITGKLIGGWVATRLHRQVTAGELGLHLMAPGLLGIALALHLLQVVRTPGMTALLTAVVGATLASEALALVLRPSEDVRG